MRPRDLTPRHPSLVQKLANELRVLGTNGTTREADAKALQAVRKALLAEDGVMPPDVIIEQTGLLVRQLARDLELPPFTIGAGSASNKMRHHLIARGELPKLAQKASG